VFEFQVKVQETINGKTQQVWLSVRPTHGTPYQYQTREEALRMLNLCYPEVSSEEKRVIETEKEKVTK
jgi:hypothetical protein